MDPNKDQKRYGRTEPAAATAYPVAKAGYPFIICAAFFTFVFALLGLTWPALFLAAVTIFVCAFFRDPDRLIPEGDDVVVSPADGKIVKAETVTDAPFIPGPCVKISVFMSVFNVHVNRIPFTGTVRDIRYYPGKFFSANLDKASAENEHNAVILETESGQTLCFVQIAGLIARRIICGIQAGDAVIRGSRFGMICFGSRLDVYLPADTRLSVSVGDKVSAGSSVLGYLKTQE